MTQLENYLTHLQRFGIRPGLERIEALLQSAGNPHAKFPHLLIGGTNGKGSTAEFAARLLAHNGKKIGLYTSPHLYNWNERLRILPGEGLFPGAISDHELDALFESALPHIEKIAETLGQPTEFEVVTFLAMLYFAAKNVDAAVLEVGLGGKWDATNATNPMLSVVTHVALDHCDRLGDTLELIAADKVHIARPNYPFLTAETRPEILEIFAAHCEKIGAQLIGIHTGDGPFAEQNAILASCVAHEFAELLGWPRPEMDIVHREVPGRFETLSHAPKLVIDAANNPEGADFVARELELRGISPENLILVLGILADKDWRAMTQILAPRAKIVICTASDSPRALDAETLFGEAQKHTACAEIAPNVATAVARAQALADENDTILVTGSFTTISEVGRF